MRVPDGGLRAGEFPAGLLQRLGNGDRGRGRRWWYKHNTLTDLSVWFGRIWGELTEAIAYRGFCRDCSRWRVPGKGQKRRGAPA